MVVKGASPPSHSLAASHESRTRSSVGAGMNESCTERRVDGKAIPSGSFSQNLNHYSLFKVHVLNLKTNISMEALTDAHFSVASHNDSLIYTRHIHMDAFIIKRKERNKNCDFKR